MRLANLSEAMKSKRAPKWSAYCTIINPSKYIIAKMPEESMPWRTVCQRLFKVMKINYGILSHEISEIEGLVVRIPKFRSKDEAKNWHHRNDFYLKDTKAILPKLEAAFAGDPKFFADFDLWAWRGGDFTLARAGKSTLAEMPEEVAKLAVPCSLPLPPPS